MEDNKKIGDKWIDDSGNEFIVTDVQGTITISESVEPIIDEEED